jgi:hypothetical protein
MTWKINGVIVSETSKVNTNIVWGTGKKMNGVQLNVCYSYDLANLNPPFPPTPPVNFSYTDCDGNSQNISIGAGSPPTTVCAIVDSVSTGMGGGITKGSRC